MKQAVIVLLIALDLILTAKLLFRPERPKWKTISSSQLTPPAANKAAPKNREVVTQLQLVQPVTPFEAIYSSRPATFVANLRRIGCPEDTIRDIMIAEMNRRYRSQEELLKPKPADHVPWGWSAKTSEAKLIERRQQAASIAREKAATLRNALGYDVHVPMPLYAMTVSDRDFQQTIEKLPEKVRPSAYRVQDDYWNKVEQLRSITRGFWEPEDLRELQDLKQERAEALTQLTKAKP
jgi:hypothetical protein